MTLGLDEACPSLPSDIGLGSLPRLRLHRWGRGLLTVLIVYAAMRESHVGQAVRRRFPGFCAWPLTLGLRLFSAAPSECYGFANPLHVHSIDRLARNLQDLLSIVTGLKEKGVTVKFHKEKLEFVGNGVGGKTDAFQELQLHIIAAVAQFERALILERQREGIAIAKRKGKYKNVGRKPVLSAEQVRELRSRLEAGAKISALAREYGVSRQTVYNFTSV